MVKAVVGLGNPGPKYEKTRHNAGFWVIDALAAKLGVRLRDSKDDALVGAGTWRGEELLLAKPQTFMNESGRAVRALASRYGLLPQEILVVYDDLDLEPGVLRMRAKGSAAGHNGVRSVINYLGTQEFPRLRVGIGAVPDGMAGADYVLREPSEGEWTHLLAAVEAGAMAALEWATEGVERAMSRFNRKWEPA